MRLYCHRNHKHLTNKSRRMYYKSDEHAFICRECNNFAMINGSQLAWAIDNTSFMNLPKLRDLE